MQRKLNRFMLLLVIVAVAMTSAVRTTTVYADDGGTEPVTEESTPAPAGEEGTAAEAEPASAPEVPEQAPEATEPAATEAAEAVAIEPTPEEPVTVPEILEQLPEGTELAAVNQAGEVEPLATAEAAEIIATGDPIWCPESAIPGDAACTGSFGDFATLIAALAADAASATPIYGGQNGVIWVEDTYDGNDNTQISFDGTILTNLNNYNLTIQGGWSGGNNTTITGTSDADVFMTFNFWTGDVTINDFDIAATDAAGFGLVISNIGNITLDNVSVVDTPSDASGFGDGAILNNTGNVNIANSEFDRNAGNGLIVVTTGSVGLNTVSASNNTLTGAFLNSCAYGSITTGLCAGTGTVNLFSSAFNDNGFDGLEVDAGGNIAILNTLASNNGLHGAQLMSADEDGTGDVTVLGSDFIGNSNGTGLKIFTGENIEIIDVYAHSNNTGALLDTTYGTGTIYIEDSGFGSVGSGNAWTGLHAESGSTITLYAMEASDNGTNGAYLEAQGDIIVGGTFNGNVKFNYPEDPGLYAWSNGGNITLNGSAANGNVYGAGAVLNTHGNGVINVNGGQFNGNGTFGVQAQGENGGIRLDGVTASSNGVKGAYLSSYGSGNVFVGNSAFNLNGVNGLRITAGGRVDLINVTADGNGGSGVEDYSTSTAHAICLNDPVVNIAVNVNGGTFTNNGGYGLMLKPGPQGTLVFLNPATFGGNGLGDYLLDLSQQYKDCTEKPEEPSKEPNVVEVPSTGGTPVEQDCDRFSGTILKLPNGTWVKVGCPFEGFSNLEEILEEDLPGPFGAGTDFAAGIALSLTDGEGNVTLNEDGTITINFVIPKDSRARSYSILFWDLTLNDGKGGWVELPVYEAGTSFPLNPDNPDDGRTILSGVQQKENLVTVTVDFSGVFVLVSP
ncbi:MAG: right-handed parallel beta-helix repeat-containing protein [Chloroflexi bacterium]|nr:MAG: right-handed parallel beta-helix repeat-containing protein [Chloroflexota bacterium]